MVNIIFPSAEALDYIGKTKKTGFTNGIIICINLYTGSITETNVEEAIDLVHVHELIHTIDMSISEREVLYITKVIHEHLKK